MLSFQSLDVYQRAVDLSAIALAVRESLPRGTSKISDQLNRASMSMTLNIAEGYGKTSPRDKKKFYAISRGSTMECAAIFDVLRQRGLVTKEDYDEAMHFADRVIAMLTRMCE